MRTGSAFAVWLMITLSGAAAGGHAQYKPFSLNRYTVISFDGVGVRIAYDVTVGDLPAQKIRQRADDDGDGTLSKAEVGPVLAWMRALVTTGLDIRLDGVKLELDPGIGEIDLVSDQVRMYAPLRLKFLFEIPVRPGRHELVYHDQARMPSLEQTEVFVRERKGIILTRVSRTPREPGVVRRMFWEQGVLPAPVLIRFTLAEAGPGGEHAPEPNRLVDDTGPLKRALSDEQLGALGLLAALGMAFLLGSVHALSPGHGKALVAAYLIGSKGKLRHAVLLGVIVTFTHVFSVVILGLVALWASQEVLPERLAPFLSLAAGGLVLAMGGWMLVKRVRAAKAHAHTHHHTRGEVRWGELLMLGISGGMVPCFSATVVLLFAVYVGRIAFGLALIAAFSLGLAATLVVMGILVLRGRSLVERWSSGRVSGKIVALLPMASAAIVSILGAVMVVMASLRL